MSKNTIVKKIMNFPINNKCIINNKKYNIQQINYKKNEQIII